MIVTMMKYARLKEIFIPSIFSVFFLIHLLVLLIWWLSFFPGVMSPDSITQWIESSTWTINDTHPYLHTAFIGILRFFWDSPAVVSLVQIVMTAFTTATIFSFFWTNGVPRLLVKCLFVFTLISLPIGIYSVTLWKDIPFSLALVGISFFLFRKKYENSLWNWGDIVVLVVLSILVIQLRHNGVIYLLLLPLVVAGYFRKFAVAWIYPLILIPLILILRLVIPDMLHVTEKAFWLQDLFVYHNTAGIYAHFPDSTLTSDSLAMITQVLPGQEIVDKFDATYVDDLYWNPLLNQKLYESANFWQTIVHDFYYSNLWNNLSLVLYNRTLLLGSMLVGDGMTLGTTIVPNDVNLSSHYLLPALQAQITELFVNVNHSSLWRLIVWSSWFSVLILVGTFIYAWVYHIKSLQILTLIILVQLPVLFWISPVADWRFGYFFYFSTFAVIPMLFLPRLKSIQNLN